MLPFWSVRVVVQSNEIHPFCITYSGESAEIDEETALRLVEGLELVADAAMQSPQDAPSEIIKEQLTHFPG